MRHAKASGDWNEFRCFRLDRARRLARFRRHAQNSHISPARAACSQAGSGSDQHDLRGQAAVAIGRAPPMQCESAAPGGRSVPTPAPRRGRRAHRRRNRSPPPRQRRSLRPSVSCIVTPSRADFAVTVANGAPASAHTASPSACAAAAASPKGRGAEQYRKARSHAGNPHVVPPKASRQRFCGITVWRQRPDEPGPPMLEGRAGVP